MWFTSCGLGGFSSKVMSFGGGVWFRSYELWRGCVVQKLWAWGVQFKSYELWRGVWFRSCGLGGFSSTVMSLGSFNLNLTFRNPLNCTDFSSEQPSKRQWAVASYNACSTRFPCLYNRWEIYAASELL